MSRSDVLKTSVENFYSDPKHSGVLCDILEKKGGISLRNLEWFITNYSRQRNLSFVTHEGKRFTVHCSYKSTLDGYSKKLFDPFCRAEKINFKIPNTEKNIKDNQHNPHMDCGAPCARPQLDPKDTRTSQVKFIFPISKEAPPRRFWAGFGMICPPEHAWLG